MNNLRNQVTLVGNLGNDVEFKTFTNDKKVSRVSLATNDYYKNKEGELVKETQWHNIVVWGKQAENLNNVVKKGDQVLVQGKLTYRNYEDANGQKHYITEVVVNDFVKMGSPTGALAEAK